MRSSHAKVCGKRTLYFNGDEERIPSLLSLLFYDLKIPWRKSDLTSLCDRLFL